MENEALGLRELIYASVVHAHAMVTRVTAASLAFKTGSLGKSRLTVVGSSKKEGNNVDTLSHC
jgi:hypothetical protein